MDDSTRPTQKIRQTVARSACCLVAVLLAMAPHAFSATSSSPDTPVKEKIFIAAPTAHDIAITNVEAGQESLELSARYSEDGRSLVSDMNWSIMDETGAQVFEGVTELADAALPPGDYKVEAIYGTTRIIQGVSIHKGTKLTINFVLNAGGLRVLPLVKGLGRTSFASESLVFALSGTSRGQLVTTSHIPGEVLKISAGDYRIESRFNSGNAVAITQVHVKPGIMSAIEIGHLAGVAHLSFIGTSEADVQWTITDESGTALPPLNGLEANLVLKPGHYVADAKVSGKILTTKFDIAVGETRDITLGQ
jgi:hypothetical protein